MKTNININQIKRLLLCILLVASLVGCILILIVGIVPSIYMMPWPFQMLILGNASLPVWLFCIYLMYKILPSAGEEKPKGFRQWAIIYIIICGIVLYWVLWAFIFEVVTPFLSTGLRGLGLPFFVYLITVLVLTRTQIGRKLKQLLKLPERLFKEDANKNEVK